jgi:hypothetical protein
MNEWQIKNCKGCKYSDDKKVGTGEPCCTYPMKLKMDNDGNCLTKKPKK